MLESKIHINTANRIFKCDVFSNNRERKNVEGRIALSFLLRKDYKFSLMKICEILGKNHATIIHYLKKHNDYMDYNREYRDKFLEFYSSDRPKRWLCIESKYKIRTYGKRI